jgi:hypothetical protein
MIYYFAWFIFGFMLGATLVERSYDRERKSPPSEQKEK